MGIENTQFYKDATKDGWSFINRKLLPEGTPFKTLPSLDLEDIKKLNYNDLDDKGKITPTKDKGSVAPRINLMQYRRHTYLREQKTDKVKNTLEESKTMKKSQLRKIIKESIKELMNEQPPTKPLPKAKADVQRVMRIVDRYIGEKVEWAELAKAVLQFDIPAKKAAINMAFSDLPSLRAIVMKEFGDEEDTTTTTDWGLKGGNGELGADEIPSDEFEDETI